VTSYWRPTQSVANTCQDSAQPPFNYTSPFGNLTFTITCYHELEFADIGLTFATSILECSDHCARFNEHASSVFCEASSLDIGTTGPSGVNAGFSCWLKQNATGLERYNGTTNGSGVTTTAIHTAQLISSLPVIPVFLPF
jgi:hypothetical protein